MIKKIQFILFLSTLLTKGLAQPFVDIFNINSQYLPTTYKDIPPNKNITQNNTVNILIPIKLDSQNILIARFYGEQLSSAIQSGNYSSTSNLYSGFSALGLQHESKNKKWKYTTLIIPKISSDLKDQLSTYDEQLGAYALITYTQNENLKFKAGLYYNHEFFGNYFVPLVSIDWKASDRLQFYGVLPTSYKMEYAILKQKLYTGLAFRSYTRSFRLNNSLNKDYVRLNEIQLKLFVDVYLKKKFVLYAELGRTIGYSPLAYLYNTETLSTTDPVYAKLNDNFSFTLGLAYRIRSDFK